LSAHVAERRFFTYVRELTNNDLSELQQKETELEQKRKTEQSKISKLETWNPKIKNKIQKIAKCNRNTNQVLEIYNNIQDAAKANKCQPHEIAKVLGKRKHCKGFRWRAIGVEES
jgi:hypothetical protein